MRINEFYPTPTLAERADTLPVVPREPKAPAVTLALTEAALTWPMKAASLIVCDEESYRAGAECLKGIKMLRAQIAGDLDPQIKRAHEAHKELLALKAKHDAPLNDAEATLKRSMGAYHEAQERLRAAEQQRLDAKARFIEEARVLALAAAMETEAQAVGDPTLQAEAECLLAAPVQAMAEPVAPSTPKVEGVTYRDVWSYRVVNLALVPAEWFVLDEKRLAAHVRANKDKHGVTGIEAVKESVVVARAGLR